eukprot:405753_1
MAAEKKAEEEVGKKAKPSLFESRKIQMDLNQETSVNVGDQHGLLLDDGELVICTVIKYDDNNNKCVVSYKKENKMIDIELDLPCNRLCTMVTMTILKFDNTPFIGGMTIIEFDGVQHFK